MVEHSLAKAEVEGSSPSFRSWLRRLVVELTKQVICFSFLCFQLLSRRAVKSLASFVANVPRPSSMPFLLSF